MEKIKKENEQEIKAFPDQDNIFEWDAVIYGPPDTVWEGGIFILKIFFNDDYPNKPPKVVFKTKMFHPNIYDNGNICLDVLDNKWNPMYDTCAILISIRSLLSDPNTSSPANVPASKLFNEDMKSYNQKVREIVQLSWEYKPL